MVLQKVAIVAWLLHGVCGLAAAKIASSKGRNPATAVVKVCVSGGMTLFLCWKPCADRSTVLEPIVHHACTKCMRHAFLVRSMRGILAYPESGHNAFLG
jgi:hypothetical protein